MTSSIYKDTLDEVRELASTLSYWGIKEDVSEALVGKMPFSKLCQLRNDLFAKLKAEQEVECKVESILDKYDDILNREVAMLNDTKYVLNHELPATAIFCLAGATIGRLKFCVSPGDLLEFEAALGPEWIKVEGEYYSRKHTTVLVVTEGEVDK